MLLSACERYVFTFNDTPIYQPSALFSDYTIADPALSRCVTQHIADLKIIAATELERLECPHLKITHLGGLDPFSGISILNLADNDLTSLAALYSLQQLRHLNLDTNPRLDCNEAGHFEKQSVQLTLPVHCKN